MSLILLPITLLLFFESGSSLREGQSCHSKTFRGICKTLEKCPVIYDQLVAGQPLETLCMHSDLGPIVCCPSSDKYVPLSSNNTFENTISSFVPTQNLHEDKVTAIPLSNHQVPGSRAAEKCYEYSRSLYKLVFPPILTINPKPVNKSECALGLSPTLIIGGTKAEPKQFPHMAAVGYNAGRYGIKWHCGGTLISDRFVLTAAHCLNSADWGPASWIRLGEQNLLHDNDGARPQNFKIIERIRHPRYKRSTNYNDIALLKLEKKVRFNAWIRPACLPTSDDDFELAVATGWGRVDWTDEEGSADLLAVTLKTVSAVRCNFFYRDADQILKRGIDAETQICAGEEGKDTCQGDSGGPLAIFNKQHYCMYDVVGLTSLGRVCGSVVPGVYTRVSHFVSWIEDIIWP